MGILPMFSAEDKGGSETTPFASRDPLGQKLPREFPRAPPKE